MIKQKKQNSNRFDKKSNPIITNLNKQGKIKKNNSTDLIKNVKSTKKIKPKRTLRTLKNISNGNSKLTLSPKNILNRRQSIITINSKQNIIISPIFNQSAEKFVNPEDKSQISLLSIF